MFIGGGVGGIGRIGGGNGRRPSPPSPVQQGDLIAMAVVGGAVTSANAAASPIMNACAVALTFKDMGRRIAAATGGDPIADFSSLTITVQDAGFDGVNSPVTRTRTVRGTLPLKQPWPGDWSTLPSTVPANTFVSGTGAANTAWYTLAGGTKGGSAPAAFSSPGTPGSTVTDGTITWVSVSVNNDTGYVEAVSGSDVIVWAVLDYPIYATSTITGVSIGAGAYQALGVSSRATTLGLGAVTNNSTMLPPPVAPTLLSVPHQVIQGSACAAIEVEWAANHAWGSALGLGQQIAGMRARTVDANNGNPGAWVNVSTSVLSNQYTTSSPGGCAVECYRATIDASALPAGHSYIEFEFFPWLGTPFRTSEMGEGAPWRGSAQTFFHQVVKNGSNYYICTTAGVTAASGGPTGTGTGIADGTAVWNYLGNRTHQLTTQNPPARWHFWNDPATVFKRGHCHVNDTGTNAGTPQVHATYADSKAAFDAGNSYGSIGLAAAALRTYHNTSGGGLTTHDDLAGGTMWLTGTHAGVGTSAASVPSGSLFCYIRKDPVPATVKITTGTTKTGPAMVILDGVTLEATSTGNGNIILDPALDGTASLAMIQSSAVLRNGAIVGMTGGTSPEALNRCGATWYLNNTITNLFTTGNQTRTSSALVAGCVITGTVSGSITLKATNVVGTRVNARAPVTDSNGTNNGRIMPMFIVFQDSQFRSPPGVTGGRIISLRMSSDTATTAVPTFGVVLSGCLGEVATGSGDKCYEINADLSTAGTVGLIEVNCTWIGDRSNGPYNDQANYSYCGDWFRHNNIYTYNNMVWDSTGHGVANNRDGRRCQVYWGVYGVAMERNVNLLGSQGSNALGFAGYAGLRFGGDFKVTTTAAVSALFVNDQSGAKGTNGLGGGDYRPASGVTTFQRAAGRLPRRFDLAGVTRTTNDVGAYQGV